MRKPSLRFMRNTCREVPAGAAQRGRGAAAELPAGGLRLRWITSCVEERGLGEGAEGGDGVGWGELAQHLLMQYQCNQSLGCRSCSSPSSD